MSAVTCTLPKLPERLETGLPNRRAELMPHEPDEKYRGRVVIHIARTISAKGVVGVNVWMQRRAIGLIASFSVVGGNPSALEQSYPIGLRPLGDRGALCKREQWSSHTAATAYGKSPDSILAVTRK